MPFFFKKITDKTKNEKNVFLINTVLSALVAGVNDGWFYVTLCYLNLVVGYNSVDKASISEAGKGVYEESGTRA